MGGSQSQTQQGLDQGFPKLSRLWPHKELQLGNPFANQQKNMQVNTSFCLFFLFFYYLKYAASYFLTLGGQLFSFNAAVSSTSAVPSVLASMVTLFMSESEIFKAVCTHVAVVDVEDVDLGSRLDFLHPGSVPTTVKERSQG